METIRIALDWLCESGTLLITWWSDTVAERIRNTHARIIWHATNSSLSCIISIKQIKQKCYQARGLFWCGLRATLCLATDRTAKFCCFFSCLISCSWMSKATHLDFGGFLKATFLLWQWQQHSHLVPWKNQVLCWLDIAEIRKLNLRMYFRAWIFEMKSSNGNIWTRAQTLEVGKN